MRLLAAAEKHNDAGWLAGVLADADADEDADVEQNGFCARKRRKESNCGGRRVGEMLALTDNVQSCTRWPKSGRWLTAAEKRMSELKASSPTASTVVSLPRSQDTVYSPRSATLQRRTAADPSSAVTLSPLDAALGPAGALTS